MKTFPWKLGDDNFQGLPTDFDYLIHSAWKVHGTDFDAAMRANVEGTALLMTHCRAAKAMLFVSAMAVYRDHPDGRHLYKEGVDGYGGPSTYAPTYSVVKAAGEGVIRALSRLYNLPTTIARLGMAYGTYGHAGRPTRLFQAMRAGETIHVTTARHSASLIHEDDIIAQVEPLIQAAAVPPTMVNWISDEAVDEVEMIEYIGRISGIRPNVVIDDAKATTVFAGDPEMRKTITGPSKVSWKPGILKTLRHNFPEHVFKDVA
jgi:nucleoside-diphosphate-sugar epimerase